MTTEPPSDATRPSDAEARPSTMVDGRTARRDRNVTAVLDAVISLAADGEFDPTAEEIASRAGVSHRSIYRYFDGRGQLLRAAVEQVSVKIAPTLFFDGVGEGPFDERVDRFVRARVETYWTFGPIARTAFAHANEIVRAGIEDMRISLRAQLSEQFAGELEHMAPADRVLAVAIADSVFQYESLEYLTASAGLDRTQLTAALTEHLHRVFGSQSP